MTHAIAAAEKAARESYGRLLAWLAWQWRDVCAAEDALSEAFAAALSHWTRTGVPDSPEAWLLTVAKRNLLMRARRVRIEQDPKVLALVEEPLVDPVNARSIPDQRLRLLLVCAHPAIDKSMHSALMLQLVFGIDAARIANAFLISPSALGKRLGRAKAKIRDAAIAFEEPEGADLKARIDSVLEAIYGLYTVNGNSAFGPSRDDLASESIYLAQLLSESLAEDAEVHGLCALLLLCEARKRAQVNADGVFVPLYEQAPAQWNLDQIELAERALDRAVHLNSVGQFQLEAAIQSAHMQSIREGAPRWLEIVTLYEHLLQISATIGAQIGHAIAVAYATDNPNAGLALLDSIDQVRVASHQPWWASRAALLAQAGDVAQARIAYERASALSPEEATQRWLRQQARSL